MLSAWSGALDLHKLEEPDKEEILKKFEDEKEGEEVD